MTDGRANNANEYFIQLALTGYWVHSSYTVQEVHVLVVYYNENKNIFPLYNWIWMNEWKNNLCFSLAANHYHHNQLKEMF